MPTVQINNKASSAAALTAMASVVITTFTIAVLYFGREMLIPLALAALLAFLLSPIVTRVEHYVGRIAATILAVGVMFLVVGVIGWVLTRQVIDLAEQLPGYQQNIQDKLKVLKMPGSSRFTAVNKTIEEIKKALPGDEQAADAKPGDTPAASPSPANKSVTVAVPQPGGPGGGLPKTPISNAKPVPVEIVQSTNGGLTERLGLVLGTVAGPLGTGALVLLLLFCMLLQKEDLRGRLMRLIGSGNISAATRGMDDAAQRVSKYLLMQLIVNASYGVVIAIGLTIIGVPSAFVWGVLATVLRFIPYIGAWIASGFPIVLSLAASHSWAMPVETVALFLVVELVSNNVMEPLLYGSSTGVSSIALIVAAVFWTWIWGPAGLVLATPLTVCLVVMGRHVPRLAILSVLLSDEEALAPHEEFYHRLLTPGTADEAEFAVNWLKSHSRTALYDSVFIPTLATIENDHAKGQIDKDQHQLLLQEVRDVIQDVGNQPVAASQIPADKAVAEADAKEVPAPPAATCKVLCLPVRADRDELAGLMLAQLLQQSEFTASCPSAKLTTGELLEMVNQDGAEAVCVSVAPPSTVVQARYLCTKLRAQFPKLHIIVGLWGATEGLTDATARLREAGAEDVVTTLADAVLQCSKFATTLAQELTILHPIPTDEIERLLELKRLNVLDAEADPEMDQLTKKVSHVLNAPIALVTFVDKDRQFFHSQCGLPADLAQARETTRELSVCSHVVAADQVLVVEDFARDRRFAKNPLLLEHKFRSYAGAPLHAKTGHVLGSLCVLDYKPRQFSDNEKRFLQVMATEVMEIIQARYEAGQTQPVAEAVAS